MIKQLSSLNAVQNKYNILFHNVHYFPIIENIVTYSLTTTFCSPARAPRLSASVSAHLLIAGIICNVQKHSQTYTRQVHTKHPTFSKIRPSSKSPNSKVIYPNTQDHMKQSFPEGTDLEQSMAKLGDLCIIALT